MRNQETPEEDATKFLKNVAERGRRLRHSLVLGALPEVVMNANVPSEEDGCLVPAGMSRLAYYAAQLGMRVRVVKEDKSSEYPWDENGELKKSFSQNIK